ncbi:MAG TPA: cyclic nucleotide-binding domain-containing protein [Chloroflexota bacterium]|nr:cyclic nucleotide-binding domain-containing protein [Chloroflexota bacterium]
MTSVSVLQEMPLFAGLDEGQLARLLGVMRQSRVPVGTDILREGEQSDSMYVLARGAVEITKRLGIALAPESDRWRRKTIVRLSAPQFFGEMALLGDRERTATVSTCTDCDLLEVTKDSFDRLVETDLSMGYRLLYNVATVLCERLRRTDRDVLKLTAALSVALGNR